MKKIFACLMTLIMVFGLVSCQSNETTETAASTVFTPYSVEKITDFSQYGIEDGDRLSQILATGVLEVCTEPYFAPNEFIDATKTGQDQYQGMDMELAKYIADRLGVTLKIVPLEFGAVLAGIADGKYDLAISGLGYTPARAESMAMSKGYYFSSNPDDGYGFLCREGEETKYTTIESLKDAIVVTQSGSLQEGYFNEYITTDGCKELKLVSSMQDAYLSVMEGKADVAIVATSSARLFGEANGGVAVSTFRFDVSEQLSGTRIGACLTGTDSLMNVVNECIDTLLESRLIYTWHDEAEAYAKSLGVNN